MNKIEVTILILLSLLFLYLGEKSEAKETIKVLIIDTGVDLSHEEISSHVKEPFNPVDYIDYSVHGTAMASLILKDTCQEVELISCNYYPSHNSYDDSNSCFYKALSENVQYVNFSSSGKHQNDEERELLRELSNKGVVVVVAAGNDGLNLTKTGKCEGSYPACYLFKHMYIVQNIEQNGKLHEKSNYLKNKNARKEMGMDVSVLFPRGQYGKISGTSPAAAKFTNRLLKQKCKKIHKKLAIKK